MKGIIGRKDLLRLIQQDESDNRQQMQAVTTSNAGKRSAKEDNRSSSESSDSEDESSSALTHRPASTPMRALKVAGACVCVCMCCANQFVCGICFGVRKYVPVLARVQFFWVVACARREKHQVGQEGVLFAVMLILFPLRPSHTHIFPLSLALLQFMSLPSLSLPAGHSTPPSPHPLLHHSQYQRH